MTSTASMVPSTILLVMSSMPLWLLFYTLIGTRNSDWFFDHAFGEVGEFFIVFSVSVLMVLGGTTCGIEEEAVAFYPILVPVFLALGYDAIVCVGAIFLASSMGTAFSTINPFSVVIASNAAGIQFTEGIGFRALGLVLGATCVIAYLYWYCKKIKADPSFSYTYDDREEFRQRYMKNFVRTQLSHSQLVAN